jgi:hypothetical protein
MSQFKLKDFDLPSDPAKKRQALVFLLKMAESGERFEDMCLLVEQVIKHVGTSGLDAEERNLFSVAFKNSIGHRRASWRTIASENIENPQMETMFKDVLQTELQTICNTVIDLLKDYLIDDNSDDNEPQVFYNKMAGDYYRYMAECLNDDNNNATNAVNYYQKAYELAQKKLFPTHPTRLGLALNYSVFLYEISKEKQKACKLAKDAFDEAIEGLDSLEETDYRDSTLIMQLLRDNLTLWSSSDDGDDEN